MLPFRHILFPVDYSPRCQAAAPAVALMANHFDADITIVHAYQIPAVVYGEFMPVGMPPPADWETTAVQTIGRFAEEAFPGRRVDKIVEANDAGTSIRNAIHRIGADLVMMPASGHGPIRRFLLGSITSKVLHDVSCPVWTAREAMTGPPYKSVLCAVSGGAEAADILRAAAAIAKSFSASLSIVHAVDARSAVLETEYGPYRKMLMDAAESHFRRLMREQSIEAPLSIWDGQVATCVEDEAVKRAADLIVTGRGHAHGTFGQLWTHLNSIVRSAPCPVLSI